MINEIKARFSFIQLPNTNKIILLKLLQNQLSSVLEASLRMGARNTELHFIQFYIRLLYSPLNDS